MVDSIASIGDNGTVYEVENTVFFPWKSYPRIELLGPNFQSRWCISKHRSMEGAEDGHQRESPKVQSTSGPTLGMPRYIRCQSYSPPRSLFIPLHLEGASTKTNRELSDMLPPKQHPRKADMRRSSHNDQQIRPVGYLGWR